MDTPRASAGHKDILDGGSVRSVPAAGLSGNKVRAGDVVQGVTIAAKKLAPTAHFSQTSGQLRPLEFGHVGPRSTPVGDFAVLDLSTLRAGEENVLAHFIDGMRAYCKRTGAIALPRETTAATRFGLSNTTFRILNGLGVLGNTEYKRRFSEGFVDRFDSGELSQWSSQYFAARQAMMGREYHVDTPPAPGERLWKGTSLVRRKTAPANGFGE